MKRILYVTTVSSTINAFLIPHILGLLDRGYIVDCAASKNDVFNKSLTERGIKFNNIPFARSLLNIGNIASLRKIRTLIVKGRYDIVHVHTPIASAITRVACIGLKVKVIYTAHGFHFYKGAPKRNWLLFYPVEKILSYFTDTIICINKEDYMLSSSKFKNPKTIYIPGVGIKTERFIRRESDEVRKLRHKLGFKENDFIVISVGELNNNKNQLMLLEAIKKLDTESVDIKVLLVGDGIKKEEYEKYIRENELETNVILLGRRTDVPDLLNTSNLLVSTSFREGLPVNVMEGMASGLPVIVTNIRGSRDLIVPDKNGIVIEHSSDNLYEAIIKLYKNEDLRLKFGQQNQIDAQKFSIDQIVTEIIDIH